MRMHDHREIIIGYEHNYREIIIVVTTNHICQRCRRMNCLCGKYVLCVGTVWETQSCKHTFVLH